MIYLILVSLTWAFSFGLIKGNLTGIDPRFVAAARLSISLLIFLPFWKWKAGEVHFKSKLVMIGSVQYGLMYLSYIYSYQFLPAYLVALFTIFTPLYVTLFADLFRRKFSAGNLLTAFLAVSGAGIIVYSQLGDENLWAGFFILQVSNLCFAFGQVFYRRVMALHPELKDVQSFAWLYLGGAGLAGLVWALTGDELVISLSGKQWYTLLYLGVLASGICFFLWNSGARMVRAGTLAIMNNLKVPLAVAVSLLFFGEQTDLFRLFCGGAVILAALFLEQRFKSNNLSLNPIISKSINKEP